MKCITPSPPVGCGGGLSLGCMGAHRDTLGLLARNPYQMGFGVTPGTLWDLIQEKPPVQKLGFPRRSLDSLCPRPLPLGGGGGDCESRSLAHIYIFMYIHMHGYIHGHIHLYIHGDFHEYMHVHGYIHTGIYLCAWIYLCPWIYPCPYRVNTRMVLGTLQAKVCVKLGPHE